MFILLGISILLACLLTFNSLASLCSAAFWRLARQFTNGWSARAQAKILFLLRVLPAAGGLGCAIFLLAPAYIKLEPRATPERVSLKLALIALASAVGMGLAIIRGFAGWSATARLRQDWLAHGERVFIHGVAIPVYRIAHPFPVIAIVGILRPRLFIGHQVFESLTPAEISAAVEHERGHLLANDNLKRGLLRFCHDALLMIPSGRVLDRAWGEASESAADEHAALIGRHMALDLASALVKISRMISPGASPAMPAGSFFVTEESRGVKTRVRRLIQIASSDFRQDLRDPLSMNMTVWLSIFLLSFIVIAQDRASLFTYVHLFTERVVAFLN
jgi:Zn-dependent protease with chaperone function